ncbi:hypothetical protein [Schumannella soli]|uniref:Uncharacterized protein n=1 Tax=Schumannella soli TaxID=2590779 RepID=A0A506Y3N6_9MICO|nr:hypothetical protein [Schumannella soli]TPW75049.1 hypothetical protein FJ657_12595 [Schumannella soli]
MQQTAEPTRLPATSAILTPRDERTWSVTAPDDVPGIELRVSGGSVVLLDGHDELFVLPSDDSGRTLSGRGTAWLLPADALGGEPAWLLQTADGGDSAGAGAGAGAAIEAVPDADGWVVRIAAREARLIRHRARPHADVTGARFALDIPGGELLADAAAGFYWDTMVPCVVERTVAADYPDAAGYVISTLADKYLGTYPDVDHEFQIKGRLAWGDRADLHVVRRMIELQLRLMREDPTGLWRDPCAVQPDGDREYHVRRNSADGRENAEMFLATGNIAVIESVRMYIARTRDLDWLAAHIHELEGATSLVESCLDPLGRLWSDVYYEDQVIKDGRETMSASLAIRSFELLAELEQLLDRGERSAHYRARATELTSALVAPLPVGYWDKDAGRFTDWVDRSGVVHDHIHLLANVLPALFGQAEAAQTRAVAELVDRERPEFQRFPTFLSARVQDYTASEIGDGGPYDLCAAGRYWSWDAAYWSWRGDGATLRTQLDTVARQGRDDAWIMGERYDMNHVYYIDGTPWHGAAHYYEYPCVFAWVLVNEYLGVRPALDADLIIAPRVSDHGTITLEQDAYRLSWTLSDAGFELRNLADEARSFRVDLSAIAGAMGVVGAPTAQTTVELAAGASVLLPLPDAA